MKISTRGRYATRAVMCLASKFGQGPVSLKKISENQDISAKYLENIMRLLAKGGIVRSTKGKKGGFILTRDPSALSVGDVLRIAEGSLAPVACVDNSKVCKRADLCASRDMWIGLGQVMARHLDGVTIARLVQDQNKKYEKSGEKPPCL